MPKVEPKSFNFSKGERPKVLLVGNGLNRAYHGLSWDKLLNLIKQDEYKHASEYTMPMPLKAVMLSGNHLYEKMKDKEDDDPSVKKNKIHEFYEAALQPISDGQKDMMQKLLSVGFDYVLTTNYGYEIEAAVKNKNSVSKEEMLQSQRTLVSSKDTNDSMVMKYNSCVDEAGKETQVWHIHGELRTPASMILGHLYYGNLLKKCIDVYDKRRDEYTRSIREGKGHRINSWVEAFLWGDVYIVGFGMGLSEIDLWWLLEKKADRKRGSVTFYEPLPGDQTVCPLDPHKACEFPKGYVDEKQCKLKLMKVFGVQIKDLGFTVKKDEDYAEFYEKVCEDLQSTMVIEESECDLSELIE